MSLDGVIQLTNSSHWDCRKYTLIYSHGFTNNQSTPTVVAIIAAYVRNGGYNVITIDWAWGAAGPNYLDAFNNVGKVICAFFLR